MAATSASNAWAVGQAMQPPGSEVPAAALAMHWDGTSWTSVPTPQPAGKSGINYLAGVAASSARDAWAVGHYGRVRGVLHTLIVHWDGTAWKQVPSPDPCGASRDNSLTSVVMISPADAWAAGWCQSRRFYRQVLIVHWNGKAWRQVPGPAGTASNGLLFGVTATSERDVSWAVGWQSTEHDYGALASQWDGHAWQPWPGQ